MSERIEVGDLVMVVHECCALPGNSTLGNIFTVLATGIFSVDCGYCGDHSTGRHANLPDTEGDGQYWLPFSWLKRIPPLDSKEAVSEKEGVEA